MTWLWITAAVIAFLLICPVYFYVYYDGGVKIAVRVLLVKFNIPLDKSEKKPEKGKKTAKKSDGQKKKTSAQSLLADMRRIKKLAESAKKHILKAFRFRKFKAHITVGTDDPCTTALMFGSVNTLAFAVVNLVGTLIPVDKKDVSVEADFNDRQTSVLLDIVLRTFLFKLLAGLILFALDGTIKIYGKKEN